MNRPAVSYKKLHISNGLQASNKTLLLSDVFPFLNYEIFKRGNTLLTLQTKFQMLVPNKIVLDSFLAQSNIKKHN